MTFKHILISSVNWIKLLDILIVCPTWLRPVIPLRFMYTYDESAFFKLIAHCHSIMITTSRFLHKPCSAFTFLFHLNWKSTSNNEFKKIYRLQMFKTTWLSNYRGSHGVCVIFFLCHWLIIRHACSFSYPSFYCTTNHLFFRLSFCSSLNLFFINCV